MIYTDISKNIYDWPPAAAPFCRSRQVSERLVWARHSTWMTTGFVGRSPKKLPLRSAEEGDVVSQHIYPGPRVGGCPNCCSPQANHENHDWPPAAAPFCRSRQVSERLVWARHSTWMTTGFVGRSPKKLPLRSAEEGDVVSQHIYPYLKDADSRAKLH